MRAIGNGWKRIFGVLVSLVAVAALSACAQQTDIEDLPTEEGAELPAWVERVQPAPNSTSSGVSIVEVSHRVRGNQEGVRLLIDGIDVTTYADISRGLIHYDPSGTLDGQKAPVQLDSGTHEAVLQRVELPSFGEQHEVVDEFRWEFTIR